MSKVLLSWSDKQQPEGSYAFDSEGPDRQAYNREMMLS